MNKDASAIFRSQVGFGELERLSALETLKGLKTPSQVTLGELAQYLDSKGLWHQFAKITLGDLRDAFTEPPPQTVRNGSARRRKPRILEDEFGSALAERESKIKAKAEAKPDDGGMATDEIARRVLPFIEANGDVTLDEIEEYVRLDAAYEDLERKALRHHLGALVKEGRLERIGVGRHAVYSAL